MPWPVHARSRIWWRSAGVREVREVRELRGGPLATAERALVIERVKALASPPTLAVVGAADDPASASASASASAWYRRSILRGGEALGIEVREELLGISASF